MASLDEDAEIESFAAEMIDRFAPMPPEGQQLLKLISVKALCRKAHVEKLEAGPKGIIIGFRANSFANPQGLVRYIAKQGSDAKVRPDMKIVFLGDYNGRRIVCPAPKQFCASSWRSRRRRGRRGATVRKSPSQPRTKSAKAFNCPAMKSFVA